MNVTRIEGISFMRNIIDSHVHIGKHNGKTYTKEQLDVFVKSDLPNNDRLEKLLVSDIDVLYSVKDEYNGNKSALELFSKSDRYEVFASCSPKDGNVENIKRLYKEYPNRFIGLKFHPTFQNLDPLDEKYFPYMEFANENKIPCLFHSAVLVDKNGKLIKDKLEVSDPEKIYKLAKKYKDTPIVMAHLGAGWEESHDKAINILVESIKKGDANLYADISWVDIGLPRKKGEFIEGDYRAKDHIIKAIKRLKGIGDKDWNYGDQSFRLMFGSDAPLDRFSTDCAREEYTAFVNDIKHAIQTDKDLAENSEKIIDDIFYNNAKNLYLTSTTPPKPVKKSKPVGAVLAGISAIIGGLLLYKNREAISQKLKK